MTVAGLGEERFSCDESDVCIYFLLLRGAKLDDTQESTVVKLYYHPCSCKL